MSGRPFLPGADPTAAMPAGSGARVDRLEAAIAALASEQRRLERLGLEGPLAECRRQRRYWEFVRAILTLPEGAEAHGSVFGTLKLWPPEAR